MSYPVPGSRNRRLGSPGVGSGAGRAIRAARRRTLSRRLPLTVHRVSASAVENGQLELTEPIGSATTSISLIVPSVIVKASTGGSRAWVIGCEGAASLALHEIDIPTRIEHMFETAAPSLRDELADLDLLTWPEPPPDRTWADTAPSGIAALELDVDTADPAGLSDAQLIDAMVGFGRQAAWAQARQARIVAEFARRRPPDAKDLAGTDRTCAASPYAPDEVGLALRLSRWSATGRIAQSRELVERLPETLALWEAGRLDERRVTAICDATRNLPVETARAVQERVLPRAPEQTLSQLRAALARAVIAADPDGAEQRHKAARRDRRVAVNPEPDGMASLWALLPASDAVAAFRVAHPAGARLRGAGSAFHGRPPRRPARRPADRPPHPRHRRTRRRRR